MIHPHTELRLSHTDIGVGLFATQVIPRGTITWVRDPLDQIFTPADWATLPPLVQSGLERHTWRDVNDNVVLCWDLARFVNHACSPNCLSTKFGFEIAVRDIAAGEELTNDYANLGMYEGEQLECRCTSEQCRKLIVATDAEQLASRWAQDLEETWPEIGRVEQPLWSLILPEVQTSLDNTSHTLSVNGKSVCLGVG